MVEYTLYKDADYNASHSGGIQETITGKNITGATITWMLCKKNVDTTGDLDSIANSSDALVVKDNDALGGVSISDGSNGVFVVSLTDEDTNTLEPGTYAVVIRCLLSNGDVLPLGKYLITLSS